MEDTRHYAIEIEVSPRFIDDQSAPEDGRFAFAYTIRIHNRGTMPARLISRHWRITDGRGMIQLIDGAGVVGEQPVIEPGRSHDYVSGCPLGTPHGSMEGHFTFRRGDGSTFEAAIPFFPLAAPAEAG